MILEQDRNRLQNSFRSVGKAPASTSVPAITKAASGAIAAPTGVGQMAEAGIGAAAEAGSPSFALGTNAIHAFWEVLSYSQLLEDGGIKEAFLAALAQVGGCTGIYKWLHGSVSFDQGGRGEPVIDGHFSSIAGPSPYGEGIAGKVWICEYRGETAAVGCGMS